MQTRVVVALAAALAIMGCGGEVVVQNPVNEELRKEALKLNARLGEREQENKSLAEKVAEQERDKEVLNAKLNETHAPKECEKETLDPELSARLAATELENQDLKSRHKLELAQNQAEIQELTARLQTNLANQCNSHDSERERLQGENKTLQELLNLRISERDALIGEKRSHEQEVAKNQAAIEELTAQLQTNVANQCNSHDSERERLQTENRTLQEELELRISERDRLKKLTDELSDPLEQFKKTSMDYIANLKPRKLFGDRSEEDCKIFIQKLAWLSDTKRLKAVPPDQSLALTLPLPLVFDGAPKLNMPISLYVSYIHGVYSVEQNAKFLLATDDRDIVGNQAWEFKVPASFPLIYLGKRVFMLPKVLFDPLFASKKSIKFIPLDYDFNNHLKQPRGFETYLKSLDEFQAQSEFEKHRALEDRQAEIDSPIDESHEFDDDLSEV